MSRSFQLVDCRFAIHHLSCSVKQAMNSTFVQKSTFCSCVKCNALMEEAIFRLVKGLERFTVASFQESIEKMILILETIQEMHF